MLRDLEVTNAVIIFCLSSSQPPAPPEPPKSFTFIFKSLEEPGDVRKKDTFLC